MLKHEDIDIVGESKLLEENWRLRNTQLLQDRDILNLVKPIPETGKIKWISNEPKVFFETAKSLVSSYPPRFRIPLTINFKPEEKEKISKAERLLLGIYRRLDARQMARGQTYWLRELAHWILGGWYAVFTYITKDDKGVDFVADLWDPITVYPEWSNKGLKKCVRMLEIDKNVALCMAQDWVKKGLEFEWNVPQRKKHVKLINYWLDDGGDIYNAILFDKTPIKKLALEKNFKQIPIKTGAIGSPEQTSDDWQIRRGESIIAANRDMYEHENAMISLMATIIAETAYPNIISYTPSGAPAVKAEDVKGYGQVVPLRLSDKLDLLKHAATPAEANLVLSWIGNRKQKGSVPDIVYGGVPFELSGFAISQLMAAIRYKLAPYIQTMQYVISDIASDLMGQYKSGKFPKITLSTTNPRELHKGMFFVEEFEPSDVPEHLYVEVTIPITSALDKTQQILFARQALAPPQLLSRETIWDEILDVQDAEQEYARILQDEVLEMPVVKQIGMIEQMRERENFYRQQGKIAEADALKTYIMALEMQLGMRKGVPITSEAGGIPPSVMPAEATEKSPDVMRAALGVSSPGLSRRPQTAEERAESQGRKGRLVSPTGEILL